VAETTLTIHHAEGLHARPLTLFVKTAKGFKSDIRVRNVTTGSKTVNGKSPLELLLLAAQQGHEIGITATGPDAEEALAALRQLVEKNFEV